MESNDNKLNILAQKIFDEGIEKATHDAQEMVQKATEESQRIIKEAQQRADALIAEAQKEANSLKQKTETELSMSIKQAMTTLKQQISGAISGKIAQEMAATAFGNKEFVYELMSTIVNKWDAENGFSDLEVVLSEKEKADFEQFITQKHRDILSKGLTITALPQQKEGFVIQPKGGNYHIDFSEKVFNEFFAAYLKNYSKKILFG